MGRGKELRALLIVLCCYWVCGVSSSLVTRANAPKLSKGLTQNLKSLPFDEGYMPLFGENNVQLSQDGKIVKLQLNRNSGSGIISHDLYHYGFFSASMKLPEDYTAGVVTTFYTSNSDNFEHNHDELDFEFLGNIRGKEWRVQTNVYGNGSTDFGREERYKLWFDPTEDFHQYSIVWTDKRIIFFVDDIPIREIVKSEAMGGQYPSKPMSVYATIWDGSEWATAGGRYKVNYKYGPFTMELHNLILEGCAVDPSLIKDEAQSHCADEEDDNAKTVSLAELSDEQRSAMEWFRSKYIYYSYCDDSVRYPSALSECPPRDPHKPIATAHLFFGHRHHRHTHRRKRGRLHHSASSASASD